MNFLSSLPPAVLPGDSELRLFDCYIWFLRLAHDATRKNLVSFRFVVLQVSESLGVQHFADFERQHIYWDFFTDFV